MPTPVHECEKRGRNVVCPACGRVAPDFCPNDEPEGWGAQPVGFLTGSDLPVSVEERKEAEEAQQETLQEVAEAFEKVAKGRGSRKAPTPASEAPEASEEASK